MSNGIILKGKVEGFNKVQRELNQTTKATKKMGRAQKAAGASSAAMAGAMGTMAAGLNPVTLAITAVTAALAAGPVAMVGFALAAKKLAKAGIDLSADLDKIGKKAKNLGVVAEEMQLVIGAFELSGVGAESSMKAFSKLGKILGDEMVKGPGAAKDALAAFGVSAEALDKMSLREKMLKIAEGMEGIEGQSKKNAIASALFGKAGGEMLEAFKSRELLEAAIEDMEKYGVATTAQIQASEDLQDELLRLKKVTFKLKVDAFEPLIPVIGAVTKGIQNYSNAASKTGKISTFGEAVANMITPDVVSGMTSMIGLLGTMILVLQPASTHVAALGEAMAGNLRKAAKLSSLATTQMLLIPFALPKAQKEMQKLAASINKELRDLRKGSKKTKDEFEDLDDALGGGGGGGGSGGGSGGAKKIDPYYTELASLDSSLEAHKLAERSKQEALDETYRARIAFLEAGMQGEKAAWKLTEQEAVQRLHQIFGWYDTEQGKLDALKIDQARALNEEFKKLDDEESARLKQLAEERVQLLQDQAAAAASTMDSLGSIASTIGGLIASTYGENSEEGRKAAKVAFGITQSLALASAVVQTSAAVTAALANPPGPPYSIPQAVAAGVAGASQIATIVATSIQGVADAGLPPGALRQAGLNQHSLIAMRNDEMILDPVGTAAISRMLESKGSAGQPIQVRTTLELDGRVLGRVVDNHLVRSAERGTAYQNRVRYGSRG